ncbi:hypothetical protein MLD38_029519 [Melastoma candidum]|uniref:Uncharacterized protein n=1 Tax=Melastoma candidum TaxID=119954 RepID=A0ACB9N4V9_9MYRT|nr:hypothetical protein MLD38_029519 [Melastoma candidum]
MPRMMKPDCPIDYAVFQLSPRRSRCELVISSNGNTEKLASGLTKPFVDQLKVVEEQSARMVQYIKLEVRKGKHRETWFTRGTLERFIRFVSTPEILELPSSFDAEMSQLEAARKIYLQGQESQHSVSSGEGEAGITLGADTTKKELLRAIDVRLATVQKQLTAACTRAITDGFHLDSVSELLLFADCFGAVRLNEACTKFLSLCQRRPELLPLSRKIPEETVRSSCESDMSLDDLAEDLSIPVKNQPVNQGCISTYQECCYEKNEVHPDQTKTSTSNQPESSSSFVTERKNGKWGTEDNNKKVPQSDSEPIQTSQPTRRLSVQDRISLFESKQKENFGSGSGSTGKPVLGKSVELRRPPSDVSTAPLAPSAVEKAVLRRWSGTSDMSIDLIADKDYGDSPLCTPSSTSVSQVESHDAATLLEDRNLKGQHGGVGSPKFDGNIFKTKIVGTVKEERSLTSVHVPSKEEEPAVKERIPVQDSSSSLARSSVGEQQTGYEEDSDRNAGFLSGSGGGNTKQEVDSEALLVVSAQENDVVGFRNHAASSNALNSISSSGHFSHKGDTGIPIDNDRPKDPRTSQFQIRGVHGHSKSFSGQSEVFSGMKQKDTLDKVNSGDNIARHNRGKSFIRESEEASQDIGGIEKVQMGAEELSVLNMKSPRPSNAGSKTILSSKTISQSQETLVPTSSQSEQLQRARQSKGNQELNDELKMKANKLEKLFAEHKSRVPNDQSSSARRNKVADLQKESMGSSQIRKVPSKEAALGSSSEKKTVPEARVQASSASSFRTPPTKFADSEDMSGILRRNFSDLSYLDESRGKFYEKYMKRRDAKLRDEWGSKRAEKEAKLKAMHDRLEQSTADMKAKFSGSADRQDPSYASGHHTERVRSFNGRSNVREQIVNLRK